MAVVSDVCTCVSVHVHVCEHAATLTWDCAISQQNVNVLAGDVWVYVWEVKDSPSIHDRFQPVPSDTALESCLHQSQQLAVKFQTVLPHCSASSAKVWGRPNEV